jgi:salicylate hydroxylase
VSIYERRDFDVEVGASISCAANGTPQIEVSIAISHYTLGTQWLREWEVDISKMKPVILMKLTMRDWETGKILNQYDLEDYEKTWGNVYNMSVPCLPIYLLCC